MSWLEIRLAAYALLAIAACGALLWERHSGYKECEAGQKAADTAQHARDLETNRELTDENQRLRDQLTAPGGLASKPPPALRVCVPHSVMPARSAAPGPQPGIAAASASNSGMPGGAQADTAVDYGPVVQDVALAGVLRATNGDLLYGFAVKQARTQ